MHHLQAQKDVTRHIHHIANELLPLTHAAKQRVGHSALEKIRTTAADQKKAVPLHKAAVGERKHRAHFNIGNQDWLKMKKEALARRENRLRAEALARRVIAKWKRLVKPDLIVRAKHFHRRKVLRRAFSLWVHRFDGAKVLWKKEFIMQTRVKFDRLHHFFNRWREAVVLSQQFRETIAEKEIFAQKHWRKTVISKFFSGWRQFILQQEEKRRKNGTRRETIFFLTIIRNGSQVAL